MRAIVSSVCVILLSVVVVHGSLNDEYDSDKRYHPRLPDENAPVKSSRNAEDEQTIEYWRNQAKATVEKHSKRTENKNIAKNVIMFLGDGMSISTVALARIHAGGEETPLSFEQFPYTGMAKTYCVDYQCCDLEFFGSKYP